MIPPKEDPLQRPRRSVLDDNRLIAGLIVAYSCVAAAVLSKLPLWLDEILQIIGTKGRTFVQIVEWVPGSAGGVPLGYFVQSVVIGILGYSVFTARLPSLIFSVLGCMALVWLGRELQLKRAAVAVLLMMALPLQFRYALEGRIYAQAVFCVILMTALALRLARQSKPLWVLLYGLAVVAGVMTSPLLVSFPLAHFAWASVCLSGKERRRTQFHIAISWAVGSILLTFWVLWMRTRWIEAVVGNQEHFHFDYRLFLMLLRELGGGGYILSSLLLIAVCAGLLSRGISRSTRVLLLSIVIVPMAATIALDAAWDYFFAIRQMTPLIPGLALLAAEGVRDLYARRRILGLLLVTALVCTALVHDVLWFGRPRENWGLAASVLKASAQDACLLFVPVDAMYTYSFFVPDLPSRGCRQLGPSPEQRRIIVVATPYSPPADVTAVRRKLEGAGMTRVQSTAAGGTGMVLYESAP